jgi:ribonuclease T2
MPNNRPNRPNRPNRKVLLAALGVLLMLSGGIGLIEELWPANETDAATAQRQSSTVSSKAVSQTASQRADAFDFWVLALSWLPSYCANGRDDPEQCGPDAPDGMVVHGLWPQNEQGYPEFCDAGPRRIPRAIARSIDDLIPSDDAVFYQWRKHGRCADDDPERYFQKVRTAAERVTIPALFDRAATERQKLSAHAIEEAFINANPGLRRDMLAVSCHSGQIRDVRVCLTPELAFRTCHEVDARGCTRTLDIPSARR